MGATTGRILKGLGVGLVTGLLGVMFGLTNLGASFERDVGLAWLFSIRGEIPPPADVAVVGINSRTGEQLGLSNLPREWPRTVHAQLVEALTRQGASAIVFDMQFDKPKSAADDRAFATAVDTSDRVVLIELVTGKRQPLTDKDGRITGTIWVEELIKPMPALVETAKGLATFPLPKLDASVYEFWVFKESVGDAATLPAVALQVHALQAYPALYSLLREVDPANTASLPQHLNEVGKAENVKDMMQTLRTALEGNPAASGRLHSLIEQASPRSSPDAHRLLMALHGLYSGDAHRMINFYGPPGTIPTIPYESVLKAGAEQSGQPGFNFQGKTVFVGFSDLYDPGQPDRFYTVFTSEDGVDLSGVEIAATAFANLLTDRSIRLLGSWETLALLLLFGVALGLVTYWLPAMLGVPLAIGLAVTYAVSAQWLFNQGDWWMPMATPLLGQFPLALFLGLMGQYLLERRRGQRISAALSYYLPENVAKDLTQNRSDPNAFNKVVYGTCLATDMSGFSTISEQLPPDELAVFLNDYFDTLATALKRHQVDVTEFRADAIMCAWTSEKPSVGVRRKAVLAALEAAEAIEGFKQRHAMLKSSLRIGLESGHFYIGHAGGGGHFVFSIVGDTANTASRIESLNKHVGTRILATSEAIEGLDGLLLRPLGAFQFVGKTEAIPIVEIMATTAHQTEAQLQLAEGFAAALETYQSGDWQGAADRFTALLAQYPDDGPSGFYLARCRTYLEGAPAPDDPGVVRMESK